MSLTDMACKNAKPRLKLYKLSDAGGLCLRVTTTGGKYWVFRYRFDGKEKNLSLGVYPVISLIAARAARDEAKKALREGRDPNVIKITRKLDAHESQSNLFEEIGNEWWDVQSKIWKPKYAAQVKNRLEGDIYPAFGKVPILEILPRHILVPLRKVQQRGAIETAHRLKQYVGMIFRYAVACGKAERDMSADLRGALIATKSKNFASIEIDELSFLLEKLTDIEVSMGIQTRLAMRFLMLTFVRTSELIGMVKSEVNFEKKLWIIPANRIKKERDHMVPLSDQAIQILQTAQSLAKSEYFWPKHRDPKHHMSNNTILKGLARMGYKGKMTGHGFRALANTTLVETLSYDPELVDLQLAHSPKKIRGKTSAAYNRAKFIKQRTVMMQVWADYIDQVEAGKAS